jgi:hypothetical protein
MIATPSPSMYRSMPDAPLGRAEPARVLAHRPGDRRGRQHPGREERRGFPSDQDVLAAVLKALHD